MKGGNIVITRHYTHWMLLFTSFMLDFIDSLSVCFDRFSEDYSQTLNTIPCITMNNNSSESLAAKRRGCGANKNNYKIVCLLYYILYTTTSSISYSLGIVCTVAQHSQCAQYCHSELDIFGLMV